MASGGILTMEYLTLVPGSELASTSKTGDSSTNEMVAFHVEDTTSRSWADRNNQVAAWLQLNADASQRDLAMQGIHPAVRDESKDTADGDNECLLQDTEPSRRSDELLQPTAPSTAESRPSEEVDTDSINLKPPEIPPRILTMDEISKHNKLHDMWLVINNEVYDVTQFQHRHPGGPKILYGVAGKEATKKFDKYHRRALLESYKPIFKIGIVSQHEAASTPRKGLLGMMGIGKKKA